MERDLLKYKHQIEQIERDEQKLSGSLETLIQNCETELGLESVKGRDVTDIMRRLEEKIRELEITFRKTEIKFDKAMKKIQEFDKALKKIEDPDNELCEED